MLSRGKNLPGRKVSVEMCPAFWVMYWSIEDSRLILIFLRRLDKILWFWEKILSYYEMSKPCSGKCQHPRVQSRFENPHPHADLSTLVSGLRKPWGPAGCLGAHQRCEGAAPTKGGWPLVLWLPRIFPGKSVGSQSFPSLIEASHERQLWETWFPKITHRIKSGVLTFSETYAPLGLYEPLWTLSPENHMYQILHENVRTLDLKLIKCKVLKGWLGVCHC